MHHILFYSYVDDILERRGPYREEHLRRIHAGKEAGRILLSGPLGDPPRGAAIVFEGVEPSEIEAFARGDPYVTAGLVTERRVELWTLV